MNSNSTTNLTNKPMHIKRLLAMALIAMFISACSKSDNSVVGKTGSIQDDSSASDFVITNGKIYTVNPDQEWAEAVAVSGNTIVYVGDNAGAKAFVGKELDKQFLLALTSPWNLLNWCPVVNVPTTLSSQGMPMGMQIVSRPYHDAKVFQIVHAYESGALRLFTGSQMPDFRNNG